MTREQILSMYGEGPYIGEGDFGSDIGVPDLGIQPMELRNVPTLSNLTGNYLSNIPKIETPHFYEIEPYTQRQPAYDVPNQPIWDPNFVNPDGSVGRLHSISEIRDYMEGRVDMGIRKGDDWGGPFQQLGDLGANIWGGIQSGIGDIGSGIAGLLGISQENNLADISSTGDGIGQVGTGDNPSPKDYPKY